MNFCARHKMNHTEWYLPSLIALDKHVKYYRDLLRSTEQVELRMAHLGKTELFTESEASDLQDSGDYIRYPTILVNLKEDTDPRLSLRVGTDGKVSVPEEYKDWQMIQSKRDDGRPESPAIKVDAIAALTLAKRQQLLQAANQPRRADSPKRRKYSNAWD